MTPLIRSWRRWATSLAALGLVGGLYALTQLPTLPAEERSQLAADFRFEQTPLPEPSGLRPRQVRLVHPSLERISAWVSATGAGAALGDLDGDGLPNDLCHVDPRFDLAVVMPAPGTGDRYPPFVLHPAPYCYDAATMAPTGCLIGDFNEDGLMDVLVYYWGRTPVLFLRKQVSDSTPRIGLQGDDFEPCELAAAGDPDNEGKPYRWYSHAATLTDLDGDGHLDLIVGSFFQDGADVLNAAGGGVRTVMQAGKSKAFNGGGPRFFLWQKGTSGPRPTVAYREDEGARELVGTRWVLAAGAADLDGDGLPEVYLAHDFGPDRLLHNRSRLGRLRFAVVEGKRDFITPKSCILGHDSFKGMGVDFADVNGDGWLDIYVSNIGDVWGLQESHFLWQSTGEIHRFQEGIAPYVQASERLGLSRGGWGWDTKLADFNNDGELEAIMATGFIKGEVPRWAELQALGTSNDSLINDPRFWPRFQPGDDVSGHNTTPFYVRAGDGRFYDIAHEVSVRRGDADHEEHLDQAQNTRGIAVADVDGDGKLDFVCANQWGPSFFFRNDSPAAGQFLGLKLLLPLPGRSSVGRFCKSSGRGDDLQNRPTEPTANGQCRVADGRPSVPELRSKQMFGRPAVGTQATVKLPDGRRFVAQVDGGNGHAGRRSPELHFGLGQLDKEAVIEVELDWRDGNGQRQRDTLHLKAGWHTVLLAGNTEGG